MVEWMSATMKFPLLVYSILLFVHPAVYGQTRLQMRNRTAAVKERRDGLIQEAVRSLLGVKESSSRGNPVGRRPPTPPRYMLDLYDRYRSGQVPTQGNTVRSILPMRGKLEGVDMLVFNLTGIHSEEQILQAKLHIFKRRRVKGARKRELSHLRLKVTDLTRKTAPMLVNVAREQHGWQAYEITEAVFQCREVKHDGHYLLGVTMETSRPNGKYKAIPMRRVVRLNSQPFLIIFSEDRENTTHQLASSDSQEDGEEDVVEGDGRDERDPVRSKFSRLSDDIIMSRIKRSIFTNEVPDYSLYVDDIDKNYSYNFYAKAKHRKVDPNIIPSPNDLKPRKPLKRVHKAKKNRRNRKLPHWWARHKKSYHPHNDPSDLCQRKKLVVSFSHIGWGEWIISPKSFEAHYCTGMCSFPLTKDLKPSNHATIQSLVHALGLYPHVPAPCCVPDAASSLTLLYFDEDRNVVLKNYPNMIVESCACK